LARGPRITRSGGARCCSITTESAFVLLLVEVGTDFDTPPLAVLRQILQPGILAQNRPSRVAVLTTFTQESKATTALQNNLEVQIRFLSPNQRCEAKAWLLAFATPHSLPPILD
jgi:hypothetical protein